MAEKTVQTRIQHKHDTAENWAKAVNFVPLAGEIIIYDEISDNGNTSVSHIKIGDGTTSINDLEFIVNTEQINAAINDHINNKNNPHNVTADDLNTYTKEEVDNLMRNFISSGTADPTTTTTGNFYFKYLA